MAAPGAPQRSPVAGGPAAPTRPRVLRTDALGAQRAAWDALVDQMPLASPFLRSWWLDAMAVETPSYVLVLDGDRLLGGIALEEHRRGGLTRYRYIGDALGDHLDVVAHRDHERVVLDALQTWWGRPGSRLLEVDFGAAGAGLLGSAFPRRSVVDPGMVAPFTALPGTFDELARGLPGQLRSTIARSTKRLAREGVVHRVVDAPADVDRALDELYRLHGERWAERSAFLAEFPRFAAAARAGARAGEVVFHELVHEGTVIAIEVDLEVAGRVSFFQAGRIDDRRWRGSGTMLKAKVVARACELGRREYDLLRGAEPYKDSWATGTRDLVRIRAAHGPVAYGALGIDRTRRLARDARRRVLAARAGEG